MADVKVTKAMMFTAISNMVQDEAEIEVDGVAITGFDVKQFCNANLEQLASKAEKAKERTAKNREVSDMMTTQIYEVLTEELQTADDIVEVLGNAEITRSKVVARLTKLINAGKVIKEQVKFDDGVKKMGYKLA